MTHISGTRETLPGTGPQRLVEMKTGLKAGTVGVSTSWVACSPGAHRLKLDCASCFSAAVVAAGAVALGCSMQQRMRAWPVDHASSAVSLRMHDTLLEILV